MNHLESTFSGRNNLWRYIVMIAAVIIASNTIGAVPLLIGMLVKSASTPEVFSQLAANPNDYSVLGLDQNILLIMMIFPFIAGLAAFILLVKPLNERTFKATINGTGKIRWNRFFISGFVWLILSALYLFIYLNFNPSNFTINNRSISLVILIVISVLLFPFQAAFEEVIFRGYLMQGFSTVLRSRWFPLVMTSIFFGLMHALNPEVKEFGFFTMMPQYILFGLIFGVITIMDDGIEAALGAHAANNIFVCITVTNKASALQTPALYEQTNIYPWTEFVGLLLTGIIFITILRIIFKWDDFSLIFSEVKALKSPDQIP
jgi:membrane protease YdiL (CAAX protease family)